jgi:hypothetical protein
MAGPKTYRKIVEKGKFVPIKAQIYDRSLSWHGTGTLIKKKKWW